MQSNLAEPVVNQRQSEIPKQSKGSNYREIQHWAEVLHWKKDENPQAKVNQTLSKYAHNFEQFVRGIKPESSSKPLNFKTMDATLKTWLASPKLTDLLERRVAVLSKLKADGAINAEKILTLYEYERLKFKLLNPEEAVLWGDGYGYSSKESVGAKLSGLYNQILIPDHLQKAIALDKYMDLVDDNVMSRFIDLFNYEFSLKDFDSYVPLLRFLKNISEDEYRKVFTELQSHKFLLPSTYLSRSNFFYGKDEDTSQANKRYLDLLTNAFDKGGFTNKQREMFDIFERSHRFSDANTVFDSGVFTDDEAKKLVNQQILIGELLERPQITIKDRHYLMSEESTTAKEHLDYHLQSELIKKIEETMEPADVANLVEYVSYGGDPDLVSLEKEYNSKRIDINSRMGIAAATQLAILRPFVSLGYQEEIQKYFPNLFSYKNRNANMEKDMEYFARSVYIVENLCSDLVERNDLIKLIFRPRRIFYDNETDTVVDYVFSQLTGRRGSNIDENIKNNWKFLFRVNAEYSNVIEDGYRNSGATEKYFSFTSIHEIINELWTREANVDVSKLLSGDDLNMLTDAQREFWTLFKGFDDEHKQLIRQIDWNVNDLTTEVLGRIEQLFQARQYLKETKSKELRYVYGQVSSLLQDVDNPMERAKELRSIFERNNLPQIATSFKVFELLYPPEKISEILSDYDDLSPVLKKAGSLRRSHIMYKDLLRVHLLSANPSLKAYLEAIRDGNSVLQKYDSVGYAELSELEKAQLNRFVTRAERLFSASRFNRIHNSAVSSDVDIDTQISTLRSSFQVQDGQTFLGRIEEMFLKPLGLSSIDEALSLMDSAVFDSNSRSKDNVIHLQVGDLIKGVTLENIDAILKTGMVAREFLGAGARSDSTPFDADFLRIDEISASTPIKSFASSTKASGYGNILLIVKNRNQFRITTQYEDMRVLPEDKYELFFSGVIGDNHYGVRTGLPSTQIDGIVLTEEGNALDREQLCMTIALNGIYIPIYNAEGELIYTKDDFEKYTLAGAEVHRALNNSLLIPKDLIEALKKTDYIKNLYEETVGVWEGYSLEEHSLMVLEQFKKYFFDNFSSPLISRDGFSLMLALHDIGKPLAVRIEQDTTQQHKYGLRFIPHIASGLGLSTYESELITVLANQDVLGSFIQNKISLEQAGALIRDKAKEVGVPVQDFFELVKTYYMCDASAYTLDAGGKSSLDFLFDVSDGTIKLKNQYRRQLDELEPYIYIEN